MEKRVLIAVLLCIAVLYGYSFFAPQPPKKVESTQQAPAKEQAVPAPAPAQPPSGSLSAAPVLPGAEKDITVETELFTAVFSTHGASLKKLVLKNYKDSAGAAGKPEALVNETAPENFTLRTSARGFDLAPAPLFSVVQGDFKIGKGEKRDIEFNYSSSQGLVFKKTVTLYGDSYSMDLKEQLANTGTGKQSGALLISLSNRIDPAEADSSLGSYGPVAFAEQKLFNEKVKDLAKGPKNFDRNLSWAGFEDKYFLAAVLGHDNSVGGAQFLKTPSNRVESVITSPPLALNPGDTTTLSYKVYLGPKDLDILKAQGNNLEEVIDFGWFSAIAKPLLYAIKYFYKYTGNYGIAIIIITVILKILFFPLTHKSYKSMKEMQKIQPKMTELREKFKNDRDAMNRAVMELYKTHKVNPLGGCLPMLVQIPVFFALYKALMFSIELRHAPFMLWITDLSAKDPYYVTPVIMGVTMFIQQKMTPTNMDPMQAKMMLALPVVFTFMFLNFPSGLVLYWLVNNILTIAQQAYINKSLAST